MPPCRLPLALLLLALPQLGCPPAPPTPAQPPIEIDADRSDRPPDPPPEPRTPDIPATPPPADERPAFSTPKRDGSLADTLPAPSPQGALPGTCEGGTRRPGETWKVDCNECSCGDDGQSRCTAMACLPRPVR